MLVIVFLNTLSGQFSHPLVFLFEVFTVAGSPEVRQFKRIKIIFKAVTSLENKKKG